MKPVIRLGVILGIFWALASCSSEKQFDVISGDTASIRSDSRLIMINYWATWCLPCLEEMPELAEFRNEYQDVVEVYAVNYDNPGEEELRKQIEEIGVEIPALIEDPSVEFGYPRPDVLPGTVILDRGEVKETLYGPQTKETLEAVLEKWR
jgi:thiol-disulfide isomerase/thioredoxin